MEYGRFSSRLRHVFVTPKCTLWPHDVIDVPANRHRLATKPVHLLLQWIWRAIWCCHVVWAITTRCYRSPRSSPGRRSRRSKPNSSIRLSKMCVSKSATWADLVEAAGGFDPATRGPVAVEACVDGCGS